MSAGSTYFNVHSRDDSLRFPATPISLQIENSVSGGWLLLLKKANRHIRTGIPASVFPSELHGERGRETPGWLRGGPQPRPGGKSRGRGDLAGLALHRGGDGRVVQHDNALFRTQQGKPRSSFMASSMPACTNALTGCSPKAVSTPRPNPPRKPLVPAKPIPSRS